MQKLNEYQQRDYENAQAFARELSKYYPTTAELQEDVTNGPLILLVRDGKQYQVNKDYKGNIHIFSWPYINYKNVHYSTRGEIYKKHETNNMKVLSQKKLDAKLDACDAIERDMQEKENSTIDKRKAYIDMLKLSDVAGVIEWQYNSHYDHDKRERVNDDISGGYIDRGNLRFSFEFHDDGYISENVSVVKNYQLGLDGFIAMSDNKYINYE